MKIVHIRQKLEELDVPVDSVVMGDFDYVGEFTAKKLRNANDPNYRCYET